MSEENLVGITVEIAKLTLSPGDVLVVKSQGHLTHRALQRITEIVTPKLPSGVGLLVMDCELDITVLTKEEIEKRAAA